MNRRPGVYRTRRAALRSLLRPAAVVAGLLLAVCTAVEAQRPLIDVRLPGVGSELVEGRLTAGGVLALPVEPLEQLTGETLGPDDWITVETLRDELGPSVSVVYHPNRAALTIRDPHRVLPASKRREDVRRQRVQATPVEARDRGPWASLVTDGEDGAVQVGTKLWRFSTRATVSSRSGWRGGLSLRAFDNSWISVRGGRELPTRVAARAAVGPLQGRMTYLAERDRLRGRGSLLLGPWALTGTSDGEAVVGYRGDGFSVVGALTDDRSLLTRLSIGRSFSTLTTPTLR